MKFTGEFFVPDEKFAKLSEDREIAIEHLQRYNTVLPLVAGKEVLDIASGEGYGSFMLAEKAARVTGIDISEELVGHAAVKYKKENLFFRQGNVVAIPLEDASVDVLISFETLEHISNDDQVKFIAEAGRVLRKDGILVISTPNRKNYSDRFNYKNEFHVHELDESSFGSLLKQTFPQVELFSQGQEVVSLVSNKEEYSKKNPLQVIPIKKDHFRLEGKYLLAVCGKSGKKQLPDISSIVIESNKSYFDLTERIIQLQNEVEELGAWGRRSAAEVDQLREKVAERNKAHDVSEKIIAEKNDVIRQFEELMALREKMQKDNEGIIRVKNDIISQLEQLLVLRDKLYTDTEALNKENKAKIIQFEEETGQLRNTVESLGRINSTLTQDKSRLENELQEINQQIHQLKSEAREYQAEKIKREDEFLQLSDRISKMAWEIEEQKTAVYRLETQKILLEQRLQHIYDSEGWKLLNIYYRFKDKILPENSGRYKKLKKWFQVFKRKQKTHPASVAVSFSPVKEGPVEISVQLDPGVAFPVIFPLFDQVVVSIVMPAYNNWELTRNCLLSIYKFNDGIPFEVIVGDNLSEDETQRLPQYFTNVNYIRNKQNLGYIRNVNNAASKARGKYILTLNNDTTVTEGWLINLLNVMESDPKVGLVGSKLVYPDGTLQEAGGIIWKDASGWNYGRTSDPEMPQFNYLKEADYISGASNLVRRDLWEKLGGLDTRYIPAYFDDSDLAFSIRKLGYKVIYQPLSVVMHYEGKAHGTDTGEGVKQYQILNRKKFIEKWKNELDSFHFPNAEKVFWARDRSRNKKTILVIDHYVPHFDKDAGSRTTFQLLRLFTEMNYNVKFIGDNFYKHEPYTTILQQMGIEVLHGPWYRDNWQSWVIENGSMLDFVYLNRPHISIKYVDFIRQNISAKIIYYGHDLHFLREQRQYEVEKNPKLLESAEEWRQTERYLIQKSDTVLTLSYDEKEIMENEFSASSVKVMPAFFYNDFKPPITSFAGRRDVLFVAGFSHKPNVDAVLWFANEVWPKVTAAIKNVKFIIVGSLAPEAIVRLESATITVKGYVTDEELNEIYNKAKIVAIPLRYGAGVKGKTVEAMYHGIPIVATNFGIEGLKNIQSILKPADDATSFADSIIKLYNNENELIALSEKEVSYAKAHFSRDVIKNLISETF